MSDRFMLHGIKTSYKKTVTNHDSFNRAVRASQLRDRITMECPCGWEAVNPLSSALEFHYTQCPEAR